MNAKIVDKGSLSPSRTRNATSFINWLTLHFCSSRSPFDENSPNPVYIPFIWILAASPSLSYKYPFFLMSTCLFICFIFTLYCSNRDEFSTENVPKVQNCCPTSSIEWSFFEYKLEVQRLLRVLINDILTYCTWCFRSHSCFSLRLWRLLFMVILNIWSNQGLGLL